MYKKILAILFVLCLALPVSAKRQSEEIITTMTQLQKRTFQTRTYASSDKVLVMKALLNVFQDEGFMVYNVNSLLGFIYSVKDFDTTDPNIDISKEFGLTKSRLNYNGIKVATLESSANVTEYGDNIRVRVNFKRKLLNEYGNAQLVEDIDESSFYDDFYSKVDNALNLQKKTNVPASKELPVVQKVEPKAISVEDVIPQTVEESVFTDLESSESEEDNIIEEEVQKEEPPVLEQESNSEEVLYAQDSQKLEEVSNYSEKEQKQLEKMMQKEAKEKEKILAKEAKDQEKLAKELAREQAKQAKEEAKIIKELEKMGQ